MASGINENMYSNMPRKYPTLADLSENVENYPAIVSPVQTNYEILGLPTGVDILLEEPKCIRFAQIRILDYNEKDKQSALIDEDSIRIRRRFIGQEFLIPTGYRGRFKILSNTGRYATLISVSQIIQDLPRYIVIEEDTSYTPPGQSHATTCIAAGTRLEIKRVNATEQCRYIECVSDNSNRYMFTEDFPLHCTCVNDPDDHTFQEIADKSILLPKTVMFQNISANDVLKSGSEDARLLLKLLGGPVKLLETCVQRKVFVAWMKPEASRVQTVGLLPSTIWNTMSVEVKTFSSDSKRGKYIHDNFGKKINSSFIVTGLYTMKPEAAGVVWIRVPSQNSADDDSGTYVELSGGAPALPPRRRSFKSTSTPKTSIAEVKPRHLEQTNNLPLQGREPHRHTSPRVSTSIQEQPENNSNKENAKTSLDKIDAVYNTEEKTWHSLKERNEKHDAESESKGNKKVATLPDLKKLPTQNQSKEDFYSYSVEELVDCFRFCGLEKFAKDCFANKLDGEFFRSFNCEDLISEPFCLKTFDIMKVKMIINNGWRPRLDPK